MSSHYHRPLVRLPLDDRDRMRNIRSAAFLTSLLRFSSAVAFQPVSTRASIGARFHCCGSNLARRKLQRYHPIRRGPYYLISKSYSSTGLTARRRSKSFNRSSAMRGVKKENLPSKVCVTCGLTFTWRKKWEKCWDEVTTCSKSCNSKRRKLKQKEGKAVFRSSDDTAVVAGTRPSEKEQSKQSFDTEECSNSSVQSAGNQHFFDHRIPAAKFQRSDAYQEDIKLVGCANDGQEKPTEEIDPLALQKAERKAAKKARKAERRALREGRGDPSAGQKDCDMCKTSCDLLIRCKHAKSKEKWEMVCGKCWNIASGGVVDGDANHLDYQYGGLWKNRRKQESQLT